MRLLLLLPTLVLTAPARNERKSDLELHGISKNVVEPEQPKRLNNFVIDEDCEYFLDLEDCRKEGEEYEEHEESEEVEEHKEDELD